MKLCNKKRATLSSAQNDTELTKLIMLLSKILPKQTEIEDEQQEQILARVRERLLFQEQATTKEALPPQATETIHPSTHTTTPRRKKRDTLDGPFIQKLNKFAAVLVVGALITASLLLFNHRQPTSSTSSLPPAPLDKGVTTSAAGLDMTLRITQGPYFLSEMLAIEISLSNHTQKTAFIGLPFTKDFCGYTAGVAVNGGSKPDYAIPIATDHSCPFDDNINIPLKPNQTLKTFKYLPLTRSGKQTLTAEAAFYDGASSRQNFFPKRISLPLEKHWPSIQIDVKTHIPENRKLTFKVEGAQVTVQSLDGVPAKLVYLYGTTCQDKNGVGMSGNYAWQELTTNMVNEPGCPTNNKHWSFAFGAPGYAVVTSAISG